MGRDEIILENAREHNLKGISLSIPKNTLTVITGPSGSGKSSLAFDTIYVEGQRRYIESLSSYARQFLGQHRPPKVESITGLSPAIAIDQKSTSKNPRSTVGTTTEIYDYLRVFYARVGTLYCPDSGMEIKSYTPSEITQELMKLPDKTKIHLLAPIIFQKKGGLKKEISSFQSLGFNRIRVDGKMQMLDDELQLVKSKKHTIEIVIDRLMMRDGIQKRLTDSIEYALKQGSGIMTVLIGDDKEKIFSEKNISPATRKQFSDLEPRLFSFNSPLGACGKCNGLGVKKTFDEKRLIVDAEISILDGAIPPVLSSRFLFKMLKRVAIAEKMDIKLPFNKLPKAFIQTLLYGSEKEYRFVFSSENSRFSFKKKFPGIINSLEKKYIETGSERLRRGLEKYMNVLICQSCLGKRLNNVALSTKIDGKNIMDICELTVEKIHHWIKNLKLSKNKQLIAERLLKEITTRLNFLMDVGLEYLSLNRAAMTLSGGESQRIRLATQIGSALSGVLYVLDEPSIGLHQRDNHRLLKTLSNLRDLGNTVLVVEHDEETIRRADFVIDMGPGAGVHGGDITAQGSLEKVLSSKKSLTAGFLNGNLKIDIPEVRRTLDDFIEIKGASQNNLEKMDVKIPLGGLICITGVSGSGKSTLIHEVLTPAIKHILNPSIYYHRNNYKSICGAEKINSIIELDQSPIGRTPKSNPATYTGFFSEIRKIFAATSESKVRGYRPGRFSFNLKGGRCEDCEGNGMKKIEMHFLPDVHVTCDSCQGRRYNSETLDILYRGKNIFDILSMTIQEAQEFFKNHKLIGRILCTLLNTGLGYMQTGQSATTLSGGEAQRLKLSRELAKRAKGHCLYVLDEPTTGLHFVDIKILLNAFLQLIDQGHTVIVIEHNLDVIKTADYLIDLGPEGGDKGGMIVAIGTPEEVAKNPKSYTGKYLKSYL